jgi:hypothetical protein
VKRLALCVVAACGSSSSSTRAPLTNQTTTPDPSPEPTVTIGPPSGPCTRSSRSHKPLPPAEQRHAEQWAARGLAILEGYVARLCACADDACVKQVAGEQHRWSWDYFKPLTPRQRYEAWMVYCVPSVVLMERYFQCEEARMVP